MQAGDPSFHAKSTQSPILAPGLLPPANSVLCSLLSPGIEEELLNQAVVIRAPRQHWCNRCQLHSLPHTFHCAWCNTCVEEFDHHCMWLNNCIGRYNIRCFFLFVVFLSSYNLVVMSSCLTYLVLNNQQPFNVEKICTIVVTIPTAFYLLPLLIQLISQLSNIWTTWPRVKSAGPKPRAQKAGKASAIPQALPVSIFRSAAANSSSGGCPPDKPGERRAATAWRRFLAAVGSFLHRKGPTREESAQQLAQEAGKKKNSWPLNTTDGSTEIPIPEMPESLQLLDEDQDTHWKCQLYINRRGPPSPTGTLLSLTDI
uniref:Uncharacterized protein n=1 Tax=Sphaerodactylus townsendi TaxID=933632 RepID=A0ACB8FL09_9SAUR